MKNIIDGIFKERYEKCKAELAVKTEELESLLEELDDIEVKIENIEDDISTLKEYVSNYKTIEGEGFERIFNLISRFALRDNTTEVIFGVNVTDNSLQATDKFTYIEYFCDIPEEIKGKRVEAHTMKELENQSFYQGKFINAEHFFETT